MEVTCQRCHETLREADRYCPACGLPQLLFVEAESVAEITGAAAGTVTAVRSGTEIAWRQALQLAALVAIPAGVLCARTLAMGWIWIMLAAVWVVRLYARRAAPLRITANVGARIGLITGLMTSWLVLAINCVELWVERYLLHQGGQIDSDFGNAIEPALRLNQQMLAQAGAAGTEIASKAEAFKSFFLAPEGRAGIFLSGILMAMALLIFFAMVGGALGARLTPQLERPKA